MQLQERSLSGCLFQVMQLGAHTQLEVARVPQGEKVGKQSFGSLNVITQQYRESMGDRKKGVGK